jgi:hypothetical protein
MSQKVVWQYVSSRIWTVSTVIFGLLFASAAWPGWMNGDTGYQWLEASHTFPISDWHAPQMSWAWSFMNPDDLGPRGPFLIQAIVFFTGLTLIVHWTELRSKSAAMVVLILTLVAPTTWVVGWLTKDAYTIGFLSLSTGLFLSSTYLPKKILWHIGSGFALGLAAIGRPYLSPILLLWLMALGLMVTPPTKRSRILIAAAAPAIVISLLGIFAYPKVLPPYPNFTSGATPILDLARAECFGRPLETATPSNGVIPRFLIVNGETADVCSNFNPLIWDNLSFPADPQAPRVRLPISGAEMDILRDAWINALREFPSIIFAAKVEAGVSLLLEPANQEIPDLKSSPSIEGRIGQVDPRVKDYPSRGGVLLALLLAPAQLLSATLPFTNMGLFWVLLLPGLSLLRSIGKNRSGVRLKESIFLLSWPLIWISVFSFLTPAIDARYWLIPGFMGAISALILYIESRKTKV